MLNLDIIDWSKADDFWHLDHTRFSDDPTRRKNFFAEDFLDLSLDSNEGRHGLHFPLLQSLCLGQLSFDSAVGRLISAFSIFQLKQLKLWNCPRMADLLEYLTASEQNFPLESRRSNMDVFIILLICPSNTIQAVANRCTRVEISDDWIVFHTEQNI